MISADLRELCDRLIYCPETGAFRWRVRAHRVSAGSLAGGISSGGYLMMRDRSGRHHGGHRIAWCLVYGEEPDGPIDHINRVKSDNRIINLRRVTRSQNAINCATRSDNASGYRGVSFFKKLKRWRADIALVGGKRKYLGSYTTKEDAGAAYEAAAKEIHGEFYNPTPQAEILREVPPETLEAMKARRGSPEFVSVGDLERALGFSRQVLAMRIKRGWSLRDALLTPQGNRN